MVWSRLLANVSTVNANLPYNWNWQKKMPVASSFLGEHPILLMDIGARGDAPPELAKLRPYVTRVGFEPDADECRLLNQGTVDTYFPTIVAGAPGQQVLHLYRERGYSSVLKLGRRYEELWTGEIPIDETRQLEAITVDGFLTDHPDLTPDLLKLDTQGSELSILEGAQQSLANIGLVEVEVEFFPMYEDQPLASDVMRFMADRGFELLYLNRVFASRRQIYQGPSRGQVLFGDALFGRREDQLDGFTDEQRAKYAILLCHYGHMDIAWQILEERPELELLVPGLRSVFHRRPRVVPRAVLMQIDKVLAVALHLRRYNQRATDSDRCWPIR